MSYIIDKNCLVCNKVFKAKNTIWHIRNDRGKYCGRECSDIAHRRRLYKECLVCGTMFEIHKSRINKAKYCSMKCTAIGNIGPNGYWMDKKRPYLINTNAAKTMFVSEKVRGKNNNNWKGGITPENYKIRNSEEYKEWRLKVFSRDNFICVLCENNESGCLQADHIKKFSLYPDLRLDVDNGRTLCVECHKKTPTWGNKVPVEKEVMFYA